MAPQDFERWLKEKLNLTFTEYMNLSEADRQLLLSDYKECRQREAKKFHELQAQKEKRLKEYIEKLRLRKQKKIDEFGKT